jgi:hypothetical protein
MRGWGIAAWLAAAGCQGADPIGPGAAPPGVELCNGIDDDGDGLIDGADPDVVRRAFLDADGDGWGSTSVPSCGEPGTTDQGGDCDDASATTFPGAPERCNGVDDDCDQRVDDDDPSLVDRAYVDVDDDGFGVGAGAPRCPADGETTTPGDCDDDQPDVFPGAPQVCDGIADNDCDGAIDPNEIDDDGDGDGVCSDCDDDDPLRSSRAEEACDGIDTDCDGLVDHEDPSVNPYTCGPVCGTETLEDLQASATIDRVTLNPCYLDPRTVGLCAEDGVDLPDSGQRIHRVLTRTDVEHHREPLFLFLPPGPGNQNTKVLEWAAYSGYRVMSLGYVNDADLDKTCGLMEDGCFSDFREETLFGRDVSPYLTIDPPDSLVTRLTFALEEMGRRDPQGWRRYLDDGEIVWSNIVVAGWSVGAGNAAMLAKQHEVRGVLLLSGPKDRIYDPHPIPSSWIRGPQATDGCRFAGVYHVDEHFTANPEGDVLRLSWESLGVPFPAFVHEGSLDGFEHAILALTRYVDRQTCRAHSTPGRDDCVDDRLFDGYRSLMCAVADEGTCALPGVELSD